MRVMKWTSTRLAQSGKKGIIKPDADGYYELIVGGLNAINSAGEYYTLQGAEKLFQESSSLMRRVGKGVLKGELGHPKQIPGMTQDQFLNRVLSIEETNVSSHFRELWLDPTFGSNNPQFKNPKLCAIMAKVRPSGPHGPALEAALQNPHENVTFSIRALTHNYAHMGQTYRVLTTIVTFDQVTEQGIPIANKWDSPALESLKPGTPELKSLMERNVTLEQLENIIADNSTMAMETTKELAREAVRSTEIVTLPVIPLYERW